MANNPKPPTLQENKTFNDPYKVTENIVRNPMIAATQAAYPLDNAEHNILKGSETYILNLAINILAAAVGMFILLVVRHEFGEPIKYFEWWVFAITLSIAIILFAVNYFVPSKKKNLQKSIDKHFEENPKTVEYRERKL